MNCKDNFLKWITTENSFNSDAINKMEINKCYKSGVSLPNFETYNNEFNKENCKLINNIRKSKYIHTYDPSKFVEKIKTIKNLEIQNRILNNFTNICDLQVKRNCCNCISITLYYKKEISINDAYMYISSIYFTVKNVEKLLSDWIVRIYIDINVYSIIMNFINTRNVSQRQGGGMLDDFGYQFNNSDDENVSDNDNRYDDDDDMEKNMGNYFDDFDLPKEHSYASENKSKLLNTNQNEQNVGYKLLKFYDEIINSENVEIYTIVCPSILDDENLLNKTRSYRFLPFVDDKVNISIVREADGIVSCTDCYNINKFAKSGNILYIIPLTENANLIHGSNTYAFSAYSEWLRHYKSNIRFDFFKNKINIFDLLAGTVGLNFKLNKNVWSNSINYLTNNANIGAMTPNKAKIISVGFDEMLLLEIFKDLISVEFFGKAEKKIDDQELGYKNALLSIIVYDADSNNLNNFNVMTNLKVLEYGNEFDFNEPSVEGVNSLINRQIYVISKMIKQTFQLSDLRFENMYTMGYSTIIKNLYIYCLEHEYVQNYVNKEMNYIMLYIIDCIIGNTANSLNNGKSIVNANYVTNQERNENYNIFTMCNNGPYGKKSINYVAKEVFDLINNLIYKFKLSDDDKTFVENLNDTLNTNTIKVEKNITK